MGRPLLRVTVSVCSIVSRLSDQSRVLPDGLPARRQGGEIDLPLGEVAAVAESSEFLQAIVAGFARRMIEGISEEVDKGAVEKVLPH